MIDLIFALQSASQTIAGVIGTSALVVDAAAACVFLLIATWLQAFYFVLRGVK